MAETATRFNDKSMAAHATEGGLALVRHAASPRLRGVARDYWGYAEQTAGPLRRRELPSADIIFIVNLGAPLLVAQPQSTPLRHPHWGRLRRRAARDLRADRDRRQSGRHRAAPLPTRGVPAPGPVDGCAGQPLRPVWPDLRTMGGRVDSAIARGSDLGCPVRRARCRARRPVGGCPQPIAGSRLGLAATNHFWRSRSDRDTCRRAPLESQTAHRPFSGAGRSTAEAGCPALAFSTT